MRDIQIATSSRCVRSVGENKAPETWPFSMEFVPKGETRGLWVEGGWERKSAPFTDGGGGTQLAPGRHSFGSWLDDLAVGLFCGEQQQSHSMHVLSGDARVNKLFASAECFILWRVQVQCDQSSNYPAHTCTSLRLMTHVSIKVLCKVHTTPTG
jgi:hypothetical protein